MMAGAGGKYLFGEPSTHAVPVAGEERLYPVSRIFCVGRNYEAHAKEMGAEVDRETPFYFTKSPAALVASGSRIPYPPSTENYHYEMELVVALGKPAFRMATGVALEAVYGYACGLDMTRRDLHQVAKEKSRPWDIGKDFENAAVIAEIRRAEDIGHPAAGSIELSVNGETRQSGDLDQLIWTVPELIAHLSGLYHLGPGDLIYTGTPAGVCPVTPGDAIAGAIEDVGDIAVTIGEAD